MKTRRLKLDCGPLGSTKTDRARALICNTSASTQAGYHLELALDEGRTIERLSWTGCRFGTAESFDLAKYFDLPKGSPEIDIDALHIAGRDLWIAGTHSRAREPPKQGQEPNDPADADDPADPLARMAKIKVDRRRYLLGRLELTADGADIASPADKAAPCLEFTAAGNSLTEQPRNDEHLAPFLRRPDKENGPDIGGPAVKGNRLLLGLRGPITRGIAVVLETELNQMSCSCEPNDE
jgi:hypothetical protein